MRLTVKRNKKFYVVLLNVSKAFDKVRRDKLYSILIEENCSASLIMMQVAYGDHYFIVVNGSIKSAKEKATVSVKQGGKGSPWFYIK